MVTIKHNVNIRKERMNAVTKMPKTIEITREDYDLLDVEQDTTYHIIEEDGTVTIRKGVNR